MGTSPAPPARPDGTVRRVGLALALAGLVLALVLATVAVRAMRPAPTARDLQQVQEATEAGCRRPATAPDPAAGFALDGTVEAVTSSPDGEGAARVRLAVAEWFVGPPLDRVEVELGPAVLRQLRTDGAALVAGQRLLVSGPGWGAGHDPPGAAGCGRTRSWDPDTAAAWRTALPAAAPVRPDGPLARYPGAGFVRTASDGLPTLVGVVVLDRGCVYVHDGLTRWVPVFPAGRVAWSESSDQVVLGRARVDVGHPVRLTGSPATTGPRTGHAPAPGVRDRSTSVDPRGVPDGCDDHSPRFVAGDPPDRDAARVQPLPASDPLLAAVEDSARRTGLGPERARGDLHQDAFGTSSARISLPTTGLGELLVHLESGPVAVWPHAYAPSDAGFAWSGDPQHARHLPRPPAGAQLVVLDRADGSTQLLLRTPERVVVSVTAHLGAGAGDGAGRDEDVEALAAVARAAALSRGAGG